MTLMYIFTHSVKVISKAAELHGTNPRRLDRSVSRNESEENCDYRNHQQYMNNSSGMKS